MDMGDCDACHDTENGDLYDKYQEEAQLTQTDRQTDSVV